MWAESKYIIFGNLDILFSLCNLFIKCMPIDEVAHIGIILFSLFVYFILD